MAQWVGDLQHLAVGVVLVEGLVAERVGHRGGPLLSGGGGAVGVGVGGSATPGAVLRVAAHGGHPVGGVVGEGGRASFGAGHLDHPSVAVVAEGGGLAGGVGGAHEVAVLRAQLVGDRTLGAVFGAPAGGAGPGQIDPAAGAGLGQLEARRGARRVQVCRDGQDTTIAVGGLGQTATGVVGVGGAGPAVGQGVGAVRVLAQVLGVAGRGGEAAVGVARELHRGTGVVVVEHRVRARDIESALPVQPPGAAELAGRCGERVEGAVELELLPDARDVEVGGSEHQVAGGVVDPAGQGIGYTEPEDAVPGHFTLPARYERCSGPERPGQRGTPARVAQALRLPVAPGSFGSRRSGRGSGTWWSGRPGSNRRHGGAPVVAPVRGIGGHGAGGGERGRSRGAEGQDGEGRGEGAGGSQPGRAQETRPDAWMNHGFPPVMCAERGGRAAAGLSVTVPCASRRSLSFSCVEPGEVCEIGQRPLADFSGHFSLAPGATYGVMTFSLE